MGGYVALAMFRHAARYAQGLILCHMRAEADTPQAVEGRKKMQSLVREKGQAGVADEMLPKLLGETTPRAGRKQSNKYERSCCRARLNRYQAR